MPYSPGPDSRHQDLFTTWYEEEHVREWRPVNLVVEGNRITDQDHECTPGTEAWVKCTDCGRLIPVVVEDEEDASDD